jgi:hypothetical protein
MLAEIYLLKLEAALRAAKEAATTAPTSRFGAGHLTGCQGVLTLAICPPQLGAPLGFRTIANFGYFARAIKHMRFPAQTRESPHFGASTRAIVKHFWSVRRAWRRPNRRCSDRAQRC